MSDEKKRGPEEVKPHPASAAKCTECHVVNGHTYACRRRTTPYVTPGPASPTHVDNGDTSVPYMTREHASSITSKEGISCGGCFQAYRDGYARGRDSASVKETDRTRRCTAVLEGARCEAYLGHPGSHGTRGVPHDLRVVPVVEAMALEIAYLRHENAALQDMVLGRASVKRNDGSEKPRVPGNDELLACFCYSCADAPEHGINNPTLSRMFLCPACGNKRCPRATDHRFACTNSNEAGQFGSNYGAPASDNKGQAALRDAAQFLLDELADAEDDGNEKVASAADALRMALRPALSEALRSSDAERHAHAWKVGDLVTVHSLHPWPGVPAGSKAKVSSFKPDNVVGVVYEDHDVGELFTAAHNLRPRSAEARPCTPGTLCGALYVCPAHTKMGDQPFALAVRRVLSLDVEHCEGRYQRCIADLDAFRELFRDRERAEPDVTEFSYGFEVAREACIKWVEDNCGTANAHAMARAPVTLDPTPQRDMGKASLAHDAMMLLNATRAILGGRVPATGDIIVDAEYVRQLAINHQGALSRLVEATDAERATRIEEARAVLEGRPYEPWMGTEGVKP